MSAAFHVEWPPGAGPMAQDLTQPQQDEAEASPQWFRIKQSEFHRLDTQAGLYPAFKKATTELANSILCAPLQIKDSPWDETVTAEVLDKLAHLGARVIETLLLYGFVAIRMCHRGEGGLDDPPLPYPMELGQMDVFHRLTDEGVTQYCVGHVVKGRIQSTSGIYVFETLPPKRGRLRSVLDNCSLITQVSVSAMASAVKAQTTNTARQVLTIPPSQENQQAMRDEISVITQGDAMPGDAYLTAQARIAAGQALATTSRRAALEDVKEIMDKEAAMAFASKRAWRVDGPIGWAEHGVRTDPGTTQVTIDQTPAFPTTMTLRPEHTAVVMPSVAEPQQSLAWVEAACRQIEEAVGMYNVTENGNSSSSVTTTVLHQQRIGFAWSIVLQRIFNSLANGMVGKPTRFTIRPQAAGKDEMGMEEKVREAVIRTFARAMKRASSSRLRRRVRQKTEELVRDSGSTAKDGQFDLAALFGEDEATKPIKKRKRRDRKPAHPALKWKQTIKEEVVDDEFQGPPPTGHSEFDVLVPADQGLLIGQEGDRQGDDEEESDGTVEAEKSAAEPKDIKAPKISLLNMIDTKSIDDMLASGQMAWPEARKMLAAARGLPEESLSAEEPWLALASRQASAALRTMEASGGLMGPQGGQGSDKSSTGGYDRASIPVVSKNPDVSTDNVKTTGEVINRKQPRR